MKDYIIKDIEECYSSIKKNLSYMDSYIDEIRKLKQNAIWPITIYYKLLTILNNLEDIKGYLSSANSKDANK